MGVAAKMKVGAWLPVSFGPSSNVKPARWLAWSLLCVTLLVFHSSGLAGILVLPEVALCDRLPLDGAVSERSAKPGKGLDVVLKQLQEKQPLNVKGFSFPKTSL